jgi:hypothetical protein
MDVAPGVMAHWSESDPPGRCCVDGVAAWMRWLSRPFRRYTRLSG